MQPVDEEVAETDGIPEVDQILTALNDPENVMFLLVGEDGQPIWPNQDEGFTAAVEGFTAAADIHDGAMIAFIPSVEDVRELVIPGGETLDQLHVTAYYLGDANDINVDMRETILITIADLATRQPMITGNVFGFNVWNPDGPKSCLVAAVGGPELDDAHDSVEALADEIEFDVEQHVPWIPHITLAYAPDPRELMTDELLAKTGPVTFDRIRVAFAGDVFDFPLGG